MGGSRAPAQSWGFPGAAGGPSLGPSFPPPFFGSRVASPAQELAHAKHQAERPLRGAGAGRGDRDVPVLDAALKGSLVFI